MNDGIQLQYISKLLQIGGAIVGMIGAALMANQLTGVLPNAWDVIEVLFSAIGRGKKARGLARAAELKDEARLASIQGLGLVSLAFLLQLIGMVIDIFTFR